MALCQNFMSLTNYVQSYFIEYKKLVKLNMIDTMKSILNKITNIYFYDGIN